MVAGSSRRGINRKITEDFQDNENALYDISVMDTFHYTFVQTQIYNTESEP